MLVVILHGAIPPQAGPDEQDVLVQAQMIRETLAALGHQSRTLEVTLDLAGLAAALDALAPAAVFNLVETVENRGSLAVLATSVLEYLGIPFTGSGSAALVASSHKVLAKKLLAGGGLATPAWRDAAGAGALDPARPYIVKSVWEDASLGLDDAAIVTDGREPGPLMAQRRAEYGGEWFAEEFVEGREFNLSVLGAPQGPRVMPPAEIDFGDFPAGKPRMVGYSAKWDPESFEYHHTPRTFRFAPADGPLLARLAREAAAAWSLVGLAGYGRVDFRVDAAGRPFILELNANPCLSPDAGFPAACAQAGLDQTTMVAAILEAALA